MADHLVTLLCLPTASLLFSSVAGSAAFHVCNMADDPNGCAMNYNTQQEATDSSAPPAAKELMLIKPGGDTICLDNSDYGFVVSPGVDQNKLLLNFEGGGGCWDEFSFQNDLCVTSLERASSGIEYGVFDRTSPSNPFQNYTFVHVLYCSGDNHLFANVSRDWGGAVRRQAGYNNALSAVRWTLANVGKVSSFVLMGQSAGSIGVQLWAEHLLEVFDYERAAVIADSFAGVFPPGVQSLLFKDGGACSSHILAEDMQAKCHAGDITVQDVFSRAIKKNDEVSFGIIQSKGDEVQLVYYNAMVQSLQLNVTLLTPAGLLVEANRIFQGYTNPNFGLYAIDGSHHVFTNLDVFFSAGTLGEVNGSASMQPLLFEWTSMFASHSSKIRNQCAGPLKPNDVANGDRFCDEILFHSPHPFPARTYLVIGAVAFCPVIFALLHRLRKHRMHTSSSEPAREKTESV